MDKNIKEIEDAASEEVKEMDEKREHNDWREDFLKTFLANH